MSNWSLLSRTISRLARAEVGEILAASDDDDAGCTSRRIGVTGPPGVGKSTVVNCLASESAERGLEVAVLAVDPVSSFSRGAILGDRIRMDSATAFRNVFVRSLTSQGDDVGLCQNIADILTAVDRAGFDVTFVETVGVGQVGYSVRSLVDTLVLLLQPESGDAIQSMKAGVLEAADVVAITKSDLPGSERMESTVRWALNRSSIGRPDWVVPIVRVSVADGTGLHELQQALDHHHAWNLAHRNLEDVRQERSRYKTRALLSRAMDEALNNRRGSDEAPREYFLRVLDRMRELA